MGVGFATTKPRGYGSPRTRAFAGTTIIFRLNTSIIPMEMMDRAVAVSDMEAIGRGDGGADEGLGVAHGDLHLLALGKTGRDRGRQRAAGAVGVLGGDA